MKKIVKKCINFALKAKNGLKLVKSLDVPTTNFHYSVINTQNQHVVIREGRFWIQRTDLGAGGGGSGAVGTNRLLSDGPWVRFLLFARLRPWFKLTTRLSTGITGCDQWGWGGADSDLWNLVWDPPSDAVCLGGGGLWWGGALVWALVWRTEFVQLSWSVLLLLDLVSKLWILQTKENLYQSISCRQW